MNKKKILDMRSKGSFGYNNTAAIIEGIYELDKTIKDLGKQIKELTKHQKYLWQTLEEKNDNNSQ